MSVQPPFDRMHEVDDLGELDPAWAGTRAEWTELAGCRTRLLRRDGGDGPLVVLVHGLGGSASNWLEVMEPLAEIGDVVAPDLAGFGECAPVRANGPRPAANARFVATLINALDAGPVVLAGNSMGGLVTTLLAADHPELVDHLVLLCPALPPWLPGVRPSKFQISSFGPFLLPGVGPMLMRRRIRRMTFEEQYRSMMEGLVPDADVIPERMVRMGVANLARVRQLRWRNEAFRAAVTGLFEHQIGPGRRRTLEAMERIEAPTLYLRGAEDPLVLWATTAMVERTRPDWTIEEPEGIGHVPMIEAPEWTAQRIVSFVRGASVTPLRAGHSRSTR